jgi:hypothetical protein
VNFEDKTLLALADPTTRSAAFDQPGLESILDAGYDAATMGIAGPFEAVFDSLSLGMAVPPVGSVDGTWRTTGAIEQTDLSVQVAGLGADPAVRLDALWMGSIVARFALGGEAITNVTINWSGAGHVDAEIIAAQGSLPADPTALEQARRARLLAHVQDELDQPAEFTDADLTGWLTRLGASSATDLIEHLLGVADAAAMKISFAAPAAVAETPRPLPIAAPILIRDSAGFSLAQLLSDSKSIRERILATGTARAPSNGTRPRQTVVVVWFLPLSLFDDPDWPGAQAGETPDQARAARRAAASQWLADEGIGLVAAAGASS